MVLTMSSGQDEKGVNVTVYCKAPASRVLQHIEDPSEYEEIADVNDGYVEYQSLVELWVPPIESASEKAESVAQVLSDAGIEVAINYDEDPMPYRPSA